MNRKLKVYGWTGTKATPGSRQRQSRNIIAAHSVAELLRLTGIPRSQYSWSGGETGNAEELAAALAQPGVMLWRPLDDRDAPWASK